MKKRIWVLVLTMAFLPVAAALAQDKPVEATGSSADENNPDRKPGLDVFRVLIKPEAPPAPIIQPNVSAPPPPPPAPPPLQFSVKAIAGEAPHYVAVLNYNGNDYIAEENWESEDHAFVVKRIGPDAKGAIVVEVFNKKTNRLAHKAYEEKPIPGYEGAGGAGGGEAGAGGGGEAAGGAAGGSGAGVDPSGGGAASGPPPDAGGGSGGGAGLDSSSTPPPDAGGGGDGGGPPPQ